MAKDLSEIINTRPLLMLGMGNPMRGDDAIGHMLAESLASLNGDGFQAHAVGTAIENAMSWIRQADTVLLVDAVLETCFKPCPELLKFYPGLPAAGSTFLWRWLRRRQEAAEQPCSG